MDESFFISNVLEHCDVSYDSAYRVIYGNHINKFKTMYRNNQEVGKLEL